MDTEAQKGNGERVEAPSWMRRPRQSFSLDPPEGGHPDVHRAGPLLFFSSCPRFRVRGSLLLHREADREEFLQIPSSDQMRM